MRYGPRSNIGDKVDMKLASELSNGASNKELMQATGLSYRMLRWRMCRLHKLMGCYSRGECRLLVVHAVRGSLKRKLAASMAK